MTIYGEMSHDITISTTTTGIPYKWAEGPVVPDKVTIPAFQMYFQDFQVRVSSEDITGNVWPVGNYIGKVIFSIDDRTVPVPVSFRISNYNEAPEFPSMFLPASMIIGFFGAVLLIQRIRKH